MTYDFCVVYNTSMKTPTFGQYVRERREALRAMDRAYTVRRVALRLGVQGAYLSKVEREEVAPPGEGTIVKLAGELGEDADFLLALAGKVATDLREVIIARPVLIARLLRGLRDMPDAEVERLVSWKR